VRAVESRSIDRSSMTGGIDELKQLVEEFRIKLAITPLPGKSKKPHRKVTYLNGLMPKVPNFVIDGLEVPYVVYSNTFHNGLEAIVKRLFLVEDKNNGGYKRTPQPEEEVFDQLTPYVVELSGLLKDHVLKTRTEYVEDTPTHRRPAYRKAEQNILKHVFLKRWRSVCFFVKAQREEGKASRAICPLQDEEIIEEGVFVKSLEERSGGEMSLYEAIDLMWQNHHEVRHPVCSKGHTTEQWATILRKKWCEFADPVELEFDCSRYSQHTGEDALGIVVMLLELIFPGSSKTMLPTKNPLDTRLPDDQGNMWLISTIVNIILLDGTPWTAASAHIIINLIMIHSFTKGIRVEPMDCGDDFGLFCEREDAQKFLEMPQLMAKFGYNLKLELKEPNDDFNRVQFCRQSPVFAGGRWIMIRPPDCLLKDCIMLCGVDEVKDRMFAVGMGGAHLNFGVPVYHNFYRALVRLSGVTKMKRKHLAFAYGFKYSFYCALKEGAIESKLCPCQYDSMDRTQFYMTTGITPQVQEMLEDQYDGAVWGEQSTVWPKMW
jgi:hypothetical protein